MPKEMVMRHRLPQFGHLFSSDAYSAGYRAALGVPLLRKGDVAGVIFVAKTVPQPFTAKQRAGRMR